MQVTIIRSSSMQLFTSSFGLQRCGLEDNCPPVAAAFGTSSDAWPTAQAIAGLGPYADAVCGAIACAQMAQNHLV